MSLQMLQTCSLVCFGVAGLFLIIAIILFFILDVPALIGEVTGATERKAIENIRMQNGEDVHSKHVETKKPKKSAKVAMKLPTREDNSNPSTEKLSAEKLSMGSVNTTVLASGVNETTVLNQSDNETTLLNQDGQTNVVTDFCVELAFEYTSSQEVIE